MRYLLILMVTLLPFATSGCSSALKKQLTPPVTMYNWDACLLDTQNPTEIYCTEVVKTGRGGRVLKLNSQSSWVVLSTKDFQSVLEFFKIYCSEKPAYCLDVHRKLKEHKK